MKFKGGYNLLLKGKPSQEVRELPEPDLLYLPLFSNRINFSELCVQDGEEVKQGQVLAKDAENYSVPLLAPRAGTVKLETESRHIALEKIQKSPDEAIEVESNIPEAGKNMGSAGKKRYALLRLGAWQFFADAGTGNVPDPFGKPRAIIVLISHLEPFLVGAEALLNNRISNFAQGLEHLHSLAEGAPVYLIVPKTKSDYAAQVKNIAHRSSGIKLLEVPSKFPFDNFKLLARRLGLDKVPDKSSVWCVGTEGIMAIDHTLTSSKPCISRIISVGGPGAKTAEHVNALVGYPLPMMLESYREDFPTRVINGGVLTGKAIGEDQKGLDIECQGLTLVREHNKRELLAFTHLGFTKHAYSNTFFSAIRPSFRERYTTGIRGEKRPCVSCGFCEGVCPAEIIPHLLYKYANKDRLEEAERFGLGLCVQCGLCAHVCPSKIELKQVLFEAQEAVKQELLSEEQHS